MFRRVTALGVVLIIATTAIGVGSFAADTTATPEPVAFHETVSAGLSSTAIEESRERDLLVPQVEVFYSGYRYVLGYYGVSAYARVSQLPETTQRYGTPIAVYVSDLSTVSLRTTEDGYLAHDGTPDWVRADRAFFVRDSDGRTMAGPAVPAFSDRTDAERFASAHGGRVVRWETAVETVGTADDRRAGADASSKRAGADRDVRATAGYRDRPTSVVVGRDAPTIAAAIDRAPANTTVFVPPGTYEGNVTIRKPVTLRGAPGATVRGNDSTGVVTVRADRAAVVGLSITGTESGAGSDSSGWVGSDRGWDSWVKNAYADSSAAMRVDDADATLIADVTVTTPDTGVFVTNSTDAVVTNLTLHGSDDRYEGGMGVMWMYSNGVVQNSRFLDGRDSVATHRADGLVVRNNTMTGGRIGVHLMYTSGTLVANNTMRDQRRSGISVMTKPTNTTVVDNRVAGADIGISVAGSRAYVARNIVANNTYGFEVTTSHSIYEENVVYGNRIGAQATDLLASNSVSNNDFVSNERHAASTYSTLHVWTYDGVGNYWSGAPGRTAGDRLDRSFSPTDPVGRRLATMPAVRVVAESPGYRLTRFLRGTVPGMRTDGVVDRRPLSHPTNPDRISRAEQFADRTAVAHDSANRTAIAYDS
ncbi:NosD domain-containing protein [Haladaptatus paucihalophilus]|uniref:NosD domain-containing protein n=1 Tax=Haladaptatus paucihalophilus TaxID=367189 RepID=UPI001E36B729|nr:NosD domain-containing protein [Haladaptatus paucihalophilus]